MKIARLAGIALTLVAAAASAQLEELFSQYVRVVHPKGDFATRLVKLGPASGGGWKDVGDKKLGFRLKLPTDAQVDITPSENRVLRAQFPDTGSMPKAVLRIDSFKPAKGDATEVDADYADEYAAQYSRQAFGGKLTTTDSGMLELPKDQNLAMVGGVYGLPDGFRAFRLQCAYLSKDRQYFVTFDCADQDWNHFEDTIGRMLLTLDLKPGKK